MIFNKMCLYLSVIKEDTVVADLSSCGRECQREGSYRLKERPRTSVKHFSYPPTNSFRYFSGSCYEAPAVGVSQIKLATPPVTQRFTAARFCVPATHLLVTNRMWLTASSSARGNTVRGNAEDAHLTDTFRGLAEHRDAFRSRKWLVQ